MVDSQHYMPLGHAGQRGGAFADKSPSLRGSVSAPDQRSLNPRLTVSASYSATTGVAIALSTKSQLITLPCAASQIRFWFPNESGAAFTVQAFMAPTAQIGNGWSPYDAAGTQDTTGAAFSAVTFGQGGAESTPDQYAIGGSVTLSVPIGGAWSDWMPCAGLLLRRTDASTDQRLVLLRVQATAGTGWALAETTAGISKDAGSINGTAANFSSVTGITGLEAGDFAANSYFHCGEAQIVAVTAGHTLMAIGTSVTNGFTTTNNRSAWYRIAAHALSERYGTPFSTVWGRFNSASTTDAAIFAAASKQIVRYRPDMVFIQVANRNMNNGGATLAIANTSWQYAVQAAVLTRQCGGVPILVTVTPWTSAETPDATTEGYRLLNNARARASGMAVFDWDAVVSNGANPARILPAMNDSADNTHPGNTGHAAGALVVQDLVGRLLERAA